MTFEAVPQSKSDQLLRVAARMISMSNASRHGIQVIVEEIRSTSSVTAADACPSIRCTAWRRPRADGRARGRDAHLVRREALLADHLRRHIEPSATEHASATSRHRAAAKTASRLLALDMSRCWRVRTPGRGSIEASSSFGSIDLESVDLDNRAVPRAGPTLEVDIPSHEGRMPRPPPPRSPAPRTRRP